MASYLIKRNDEEKTITVYKCDKKGYDFKPNFSYEDINIKKITLYNPNMINNILVKKIDKSFRKITAIIIDILRNDDEDTTADGVIALSELERLRRIILNKYQNYLEKSKEEEYLKKLRLLENELRSKLTMTRQINNSFEIYEKVGKEGMIEDEEKRSSR